MRENPIDQALRDRASTLDPATRAPLVEPGSVEEERALAALDARREEERRALADSPEARARRARQWWGRHYRHGSWND